MPTLRETFSNIAEAIRTKTGKLDLMDTSEMPENIKKIAPGSLLTKITEGLTNRININVTVYEEE